MLSNISNIQLVKISSMLGVATIGMGLLYETKVSQNIKNTSFCKEALKRLRSHSGAVHLLGEPIKDGKIRLGTGAVNFVTDSTAQYQIPVKGPKEKGILYLWANRENIESEWIVERVELGLKKDPSKRLIIKESPNDSEIFK